MTNIYTDLHCRTVLCVKVYQTMCPHSYSTRENYVFHTHWNSLVRTDSIKTTKRWPLKAYYLDHQGQITGFKQIEIGANILILQVNNSMVGVFHPVGRTTWSWIKHIIFGREPEWKKSWCSDLRCKSNLNWFKLL